jgi:outer membrane autotransporter protein
VQLASLDPVAALAQGPAPAREPASGPWSAWLSGYGIFGAVGGNANAAAVHYTTGGTVFGADYRLDPAWLVGGFAGYAGSSTNAAGLPGSGSIDSYNGGVYASWAGVEQLYVDAMVGYAYNDDTLKRTLAFPGFGPVTARARTHGHQFLSSLETGRRYRFDNGIAVTPFVGLQASVLDQASFTETGADALNLAVAGQSVSSVRSQLGTRLSRDIDLADLGVGVAAGTRVNVSVKLGWAHEFADTGTTTNASFAAAPGSSFAVQGAQRGRDSALVGLGAAANLDAQTSAYLRYDADVNDRDAAHAVIGGVRLTW